MNGPERRQTPRTTVEKFVYINIEPNNGGNVLNVSEGGISFHSIAPVEANRAIRFWFRERNRQISVDGELAWMDATRKTGGLRFTALPAEGREPIRNWIAPPATSLAADEVYALSVPLRAFSGASTSRVATTDPFDSSKPLAVAPLGRGASPRWNGFSGGLATGLLLSALLGGVLFVHSYRRQIGESLIGWGARLAAKPQVAAQPESPAPQVALPKHTSIPRPPQVASPVRSSAPRAPVPIPVSQPKKPQPSTVNPAKPEQRKLAPDRQVVVASGVAARPVLKAESSPGTIGVSSTRPTISLPNTAVAPAANVAPGRSRSTPKLEQESHPGGHAVSGVYLEVGKFKDALEADQARKKLTQLGFYASVAQRNRLWMLSYYLLVGPYADDRAEPARKSLEAHGFKTQAFERGSRSFTVYGGCDTMTRLLRTGLTPNRPGMPVEECLISWESYSNRAIVKFVQDSSVVATADGRWVSRGLRFVQDAFVYRENDDGTRTLLEIQFAGMSQALVFDKSS